MTEPDKIREIIGTYEKYGWILRRLMLTAKTHQNLAAGDPLTAYITSLRQATPIDMAWFSRPPRDGGVAWELRYLGEPPFALLETIDESSPDFEDSLRAVEERLTESTGSKTSSLTSH